MNPKPKDYAHALLTLRGDRQWIPQAKARGIVAAWDPNAIPKRKRPAAPKPDGMIGFRIAEEYGKLKAARDDAEADAGEAAAQGLTPEEAKLEKAKKRLAREKAKLARLESERDELQMELTAIERATGRKILTTQARATGTGRHTAPAGIRYPHLTQLALLDGERREKYRVTNSSAIVRELHQQDLDGIKSVVRVGRTTGSTPAATAYPAIWAEYLAIKDGRKRSLLWKKNKAELRDAQTEMQK